ncbi:MAG: dipeptide/oligopeptide/nickel ABC transporter permease/ATP-binding protein [Galbitalea sp.]
MTALPESLDVKTILRAPGRARLRLVREYLRRPLGVVAAAFLLIVIVAVCLAPVISPYSPLHQDLTDALALPSPAHWLGTDRLGRDVLSRLLWGGQVSLSGLVEALAVAFVIGVFLGLIAGYRGRTTDTVISRVTEVVMSIPGIVVLLMIYGITNNNAAAGMVTLGVLCSPTIIRITRGAAMTVRRELFISASEVIGMGRARIIVQHVLPNVWGPIIVNTAVLGAVILGIQGGLNYINLGVNPPQPSWGGMVSDAQNVLAEQPWLIVPSGLLLTLVIMSLMLIADGLRDSTASTRSRPASAEPRSIAAVATDPVEPVLPGAAYPAALSVRGLSVSFSGLQVVKNVSFDVRDGQTLGIVGESGCGKTVAASAILGALGKTAHIDGVVRFDGVDLNHASQRARAKVRGTGIAFISQDPMVALDPCFTVANQLGELVGRHERLRGRARRDRVLDLLSQVGLPDPSDVARRYPHQLSGGMAQRVSIAIALAGRPRVLVADEPTTALDVTIQGEILGLLRSLQEQTGLSIVIITHDLGVVADLCDQVAVMYAGELVEIADVETIFNDPAHPYTRGLLASNPATAERGRVLRAIPGTVPAPADWPAGCHFFERCAFHTPACAAAPVALTVAPGAGEHEARCIRLGDPALDVELEGQVA